MPLLVEPTVHRFVEAADPRGRILPLVVLVECLDHLADIVEPIHEQQGLSFVRVLDGARDVGESGLRYVRVQAKWSPLELVDRSQ